MTDNTHTDEDLIALLPWYVNGTLDAAELAAVEALLERSAEARSEVKALQGVAAQVVAGERGNPLQAPAELGWRRLQRDIRATAPETVSAPRWQRFAAIAATVVIAIQAGVILQQPDSATDIQLLAGHDLQDHPLQSLGEYNVFQMRFTDQADVEAVTAGLLKFEIDVIEGPSALGIYKVTAPKRFAAAEVLAFYESQAYVDHIAQEVPD